MSEDILDRFSVAYCLSLRLPPPPQPTRKLANEAKPIPTSTKLQPPSARLDAIVEAAPYNISHRSDGPCP
jgi:hypothetical protein